VTPAPVGGSLAARVDQRRASAIGRHARLELAFEVRHGRTVLTDAYAEPPLRVGRALPEGDGVHVILASSAPGIFGGDVFEHIVRVGAGARVRLTSQSALQVHASADPGTGYIRSTYQVEGDGELRCVWDPSIPFAGARLDQSIDIRLDADARLSWSDAWTSGRSARGERWKFASFRHTLSVARCQSLEYLERYCIDDSTRAHHPWVGRDSCYFGTTLWSGWVTSADEAQRIHETLGEAEGVVSAVDALDRRLLLARITGRSGAGFHMARARASVQNR
jgi:urease accessory protein